MQWNFKSDCGKCCVKRLHPFILCSNRLYTQWRAEVWWCPGRLLDWMPTSQILVLSSGVWWSLLLDIRYLWSNNMTPYSRLETNVMSKFVDTMCIFRDPGAAVGKHARRHGLWGLAPPKSSKPPKLNHEALQIGGVFIKYQNVKPPEQM